MKVFVAQLLFMGPLLSLAKACSDVLVNATSTVVSARTMDFDVDLDTVVEVIPRNTTFQDLPVRNCSTCPDFEWQNKYGFIAFQMFRLNVAADGLNEKGLSAAFLYLEDVTEYPVLDLSPSAKPIVTSIVSYLLGNFATVDEVKVGLKQIQIGEIDDGVEGLLFPGQAQTGRLVLQVAVHDALGKSLAIEMLHGQVVVLDNPNGVLTNEPELTKQLELLENPQGDPIGGNYSPIARFQRLSLLNCIVPFGYDFDPATASFLRGSETQQAISNALHLINTIVMPIREATQWTIVRDHKEKAVYFQSTLNFQLQRLAISDFDWSSNASRQFIPVARDEWFTEVSAKFKLGNATNMTTDLPPRTQLEVMIPANATPSTDVPAPTIRSGVVGLHKNMLFVGSSALVTLASMA